jgi:hypothetical protein
MEAIMRIIVLLLSVALLSGCSQGSYQRFYTGFDGFETTPDVQLLAAGKEPELRRTDDVDRDLKVLEAIGYVPVGR